MAKRYIKKGKNKNKFFLYLIGIVIVIIIVFCIYNFFNKKENSQEIVAENTQTASENIEKHIDDNQEKNEENTELNSNEITNQIEDNQSKDNEEKAGSETSGENTKQSEYNSILLNSDMLNLKDLDNEVRSNFESKIKDSDVVRIHYKLKNLEEGTAQLYYKLNNTNLFTVTVDIASKSIINSEEIKDEELAEKPAIVDNLEEDVKNDFETYKDKLNGEDSRLNIIISNTEIVINVSYES